MSPNIRVELLLKDGQFKTCAGCGVPQHRDIFTADHGSEDGFGPLCEECANDRQTGEEFHPHKYSSGWKPQSFSRTLIRNELREQQGNRCAICEAPQEDLKKELSIDHDHETGHIRGLLCDTCNTMLGFAHDRPEVLRAGAAYLERN